MKLSLSEIKKPNQFEELVAAYFRDFQKKFSYINVRDVNLSGIGPDGGRDILIKLEINDGLSIVERTWIIQCKFHKNSLSPSQISDVNIPTLIHSYSAHGYLLVLKERPTSKLKEMFSRLDLNCRNKYKYIVWDGSELIQRLHLHPDVINQFFPKFSHFLNKKESLL
ncbi:hypothetical protein EHQ58_14830 [Leptospira ognonensis]|jgi:hypothetical protein|uniref:Restriction endonuclease type IV Mrr domain-containing protein n=1 Tax=Leptospira ognonensis TaxID=2484945 RepID=A0A4R9JYB4_9LEPT|nr:restriction endonuclease [Leptospira ognonensis]TGL57185.1 hypothetical protein EHQ58_14830 [Leptospira ognonensis]